MGLADILRSGIAIADNVTKGAQCDVTHEAWISQTFSGKPDYAAAVSRKAIVDMTRKQKNTASGQLITVVATLTFLETVAPNGAAGRREPIDPRDRITLPDGTTGPIMDSPDSVVDPLTNRPFFNTVMMLEIA